MTRMVRTNVVLDEDLVRKVMDLYGLKSKREAIDFALRQIVSEPERPEDPGKALLELQGTWSDMSDEEARRIYDSDVEDDPR